MNYLSPTQLFLRDTTAAQIVIPKEPRRDWAWGLFTGHRLYSVAYLTLGIAFLYVFQDLVWPRGRPVVTLSEYIWSCFSLLWITGGVIPGTVGFIGQLMYTHPDDLDDVQPTTQKVVFRIVSRGTNRDALIATIRSCQDRMEETPLFPYLIQVVTDITDLPLCIAFPDVHFVSVPNDYRTPHGSRFKARALHYASLLESPQITDDTWIFFLDEETHVTSSCIKGTCRMISAEKDSPMPKIGQGAILYHRLWKKFPILTLAESIRTGDDFARFYFQHKLGIALFGLHGSFILMRNDVIEKAGGFDFGPDGDITEDAFLALKLMGMGYRLGWVEGYVEEQSTQSMLDFVMQRCRWWQGLAKVSLYAPAHFGWRICLGINTVLWALAPFAMIYTIAHFFYGNEINPIIRFLANYSYATFISLYLIGLQANMREHGITNPLQKAFWWILQILLFPFFALLESAGVIWAMVKPSQGFHIVKK